MTWIVQMPQFVTNRHESVLMVSRWICLWRNEMSHLDPAIAELKIGPLNNAVLLALNTVVISLADGREQMVQALKARSANSLLSLQMDTSVRPEDLDTRIREVVKRDTDAYRDYLRMIDNLMSLLVALTKLREQGDLTWFQNPQFETPSQPNE